MTQLDRRPLLLAAAGAALFGLLALLAMGSDVVESGSLVSYAPHEDVQRIALPGGVEILVNEKAKPNADVANGLVLTLLAGIAACAALIVRTIAPQERRSLWFFGLLAAGSAFLAADEVLELVETVGYNLTFLGSRAGDLDLLVYPLPAFIFCWLFRDVLLSSRVALAFWAAAIGTVAVTTVLDSAGWSYAEPIEPFATLLLVVGAAALIVQRLRVALAPM